MSTQRGITPGTPTNAGSFKASERGEAETALGGTLVNDLPDTGWTSEEYDATQAWARSLGIDIDCGNWPNPDVVGVAWLESRDPDLASLNYTVHNSLADAEVLISRITGSPRPERGLGAVGHG